MLLHEPSGSVWQVTADPGEAKAHKSYHSFLNVCQILWKVLTRISMFRFYLSFKILGVDIFQSSLVHGGLGIMPGGSCDGGGAACSGPR